MLKLMEEIWSWWGHTGDGSVQNGVFFGRPRLARSALQVKSMAMHLRSVNREPVCLSFRSHGSGLMDWWWSKSSEEWMPRSVPCYGCGPCQTTWQSAHIIRTTFGRFPHGYGIKMTVVHAYKGICHGSLATVCHVFQRSIIKDKEINKLLATMCTVLVRLCDNSIIIMWMSQNLAIDSLTVKTSINLLLPSSWSGRRFL